MYQSIENTSFMIAFVLYVVAAILYLLYVTNLTKKVVNIATYVTIVGFITHTVAMVTRTIGAGRLPFSNQYEFALSFAYGIILSFSFSIGFINLVQSVHS